MHQRQRDIPGDRPASGEERVWDMAIEEAVNSELTPPDLIAATMARIGERQGAGAAREAVSSTAFPSLRGPARYGPDRLRASGASRRGPRAWLGVAAAAAVALTGVGLMVFSDSGIDPPRGLPPVVVGPGYDGAATPGSDIELTRGWALLIAPEGRVRVGGEWAGGATGRSVVAAGGIPDDASRAALLRIIGDEQGILLTDWEEERLMNSTMWRVRGALALCVLSGTVMLSGERLGAEDERAPEPAARDRFGNPAQPASYGSPVTVSLDRLATLDPAIDALAIDDSDRQEGDIAELKRFERLRFLDLSDCHGVSNDDLKTIGKLTTLQVLRMPQPIFGGMDPVLDSAGIAQLSGLGQLRELYLDGRSSIDGEALRVIGQLSDLRDLSLAGCQLLVTEDLSHLTALPKLEFLLLSNCPRIGGEAPAHITPALHFAKFPHLKRLDLSRTGMTDFALSYIMGRADDPELPGSMELRELRLADCNKLTGSALADIAKLEKLQVLDFTSCYAIQWHNLEHLAGLEELRVLTLAGCTGLDDRKGHVDIDGWPNGFANLEELNLAYSGIGDWALWYLRYLPALKKLDLNACVSITDAGLGALASIASEETKPPRPGRLAQFEDLDLSYCTAVTDKGCAHLAALATLKHLDLSYVQVTDEGVKSLAALRNLESLAFGAGWHEGVPRPVQRGAPEAAFPPPYDGGRVTGKGMELLAGMKSLRSLALSGCPQLTDEGFSRLAWLHQLQRLNVAYCTGLTDACLEKFQLQRSLMSQSAVLLRELYFTGCSGMTAAAIQKTVQSPRRIVEEEAKVIGPRGGVIKGEVRESDEGGERR